MALEEGERSVVCRGIGARERCAAEHDIVSVAAHVSPTAVPQEFHRSLVPVGLQDTGAAEFQEIEMRICADHRSNVIFVRCVESAMALCNFLPQQSVCPNDRRRRFEEPVVQFLVQMAPWNIMIDNQEMVTQAIEPVCITFRPARP